MTKFLMDALSNMGERLAGKLNLQGLKIRAAG